MLHKYFVLMNPKKNFYKFDYRSGLLKILELYFLTLLTSKQTISIFSVLSILIVLLFSSNLFFMKASKDFSDGHLWYSVISRPPSSTFTRVQRVSCCFSLLLCTMLTSIMFYGIPSDPSEQTMDLGTAFIYYILFLVAKKYRVEL